MKCHPYLFCELFKLGHRDPATYLASYGYDRAASPGPAEKEQTP